MHEFLRGRPPDLNRPPRTPSSRFPRAAVSAGSPAFVSAAQNARASATEPAKNGPPPSRRRGPARRFFLRASPAAGRASCARTLFRTPTPSRAALLVRTPSSRALRCEPRSFTFLPRTVRVRRRRQRSVRRTRGHPRGAFRVARVPGPGCLARRWAARAKRAADGRLWWSLLLRVRAVPPPRWAPGPYIFFVFAPPRARTCVVAGAPLVRCR